VFVLPVEVGEVDDVVGEPIVQLLAGRRVAGRREG
jgi:hypothetical protein